MNRSDQNRTIENRTMEGIWRLARFVICASVAWQWSFVSAAPMAELKALKSASCRVQDLASQITDRYQEFFNRSCYDRSVYELEYAKNSNPHFKSLEIFDSYGTANCVGLSLSLIREFREFAHFQLIPSALPNFLRDERAPLYDHTSALAKCEDGYVLLDPSMNLPKPVVLVPGETTVIDVVGLERWNLSLSLAEKKIRVQILPGDPSAPAWDERKKQDYQFSYELEEITNPDESISDLLFQSDKKILIFGLSGPSQFFYTLIYQLKKKQIEFSKTEIDKKSQHILTIPFHEFEGDSPIGEEKLLAEPEIVHLNIEKSVLLSRVRSVLKSLRNRLD